MEANSVLIKPGLIEPSELKNNKTDNEVDSSFRFPEGFLVWAKMKGHCYWPGIVTYRNKNRNQKVGPKKLLVHYLGSENQSAWVARSFVRVFQTRDDPKTFDCELSPRKIYIPSTRYQDRYNQAAILAENLLAMKLEDRLQTLGLITPKVPAKPRSRTKPKKSLEIHFQQTSPHNPKCQDNLFFYLPAKSQINIFSNGLSSTVDNGHMSACPCDDLKEEQNERFHLGSLVWAKMTGYPFWPCIVSLSFEGSYQRQGKNGPEYYCQFFNWNNDCAWVSKVMPWKTFDDIKMKQNLSSTEQKLWRPVASLSAPWKKAHAQAIQYLDKMGSEGFIHSSESSSPKVKLPSGWTLVFKNGSKVIENPEGDIFATLEEAAKSLLGKISKPPRKRSHSTGSLSRCDDKGDCNWLHMRLERIRSKKLLQNPRSVGPLEGKVQFFQDPTLPDSWAVKVVHSQDWSEARTFYLSADCKRFHSRAEALTHTSRDKFDPIRDLQVILRNFFEVKLATSKKYFSECKVKRQRDAEDDDHPQLPSINLNKWTDRSSNLSHPWLSPCFRPASVVLARMPILFLSLQSVRIEETGDETRIYNLQNGKMLAKKIKRSV